MANEFKHKTVGTILTQAEWEQSDGTGHQLDSQATGDIIYASSSSVLSRLGVGTNGDLLNLGSGIPAWTSAISTAKTIADDILLGLGTGADGVLLNRSTVLNANTALTGVMIGTPVTPAVAANSLLVSNVTASGDYLLALNNGGNSQAWHWVDSSGGTQTLYAAGVARVLLNSTGGSFTGTWSDLGTVTTVDINGGTIDGITSLTVNADLDFTGPQEISTSSTDLTLNPARNTILAKAAVLSYSEVTISSGVVTVTSNYHTIDTEGDASSDDLDTISGGQIGQFLILQAAASARDVTVKNGSGNIYTRDGADVTMTSTVTPLMLIFDNGSTWRVVAGQAGL